MLWRLNGFKYEHEAVKCHDSSLILLTKTVEEKKRSITRTDITFHHDNDTLRSVLALLTLDVGPYCVIIAQTSDPSSNAFIVLHLILFLFSGFFRCNVRGRGSGVALLWLIYHLGHESDWRIALDGTVTKQPHSLCGRAVHVRWYVWNEGFLACEFTVWFYKWWRALNAWRIRDSRINLGAGVQISQFREEGRHCTLCWLIIVDTSHDGGCQVSKIFWTLDMTWVYGFFYPFYLLPRVGTFLFY